MKFVGHNTDGSGRRMEMMELQDLTYFVGVQFHPEYLTRPFKPSPPYFGLLLASCGKLEAFLKNDGQRSPEEVNNSFYSSESSPSSGELADMGVA